MDMKSKTRDLKLMPDYDCYPLWEPSESGVDNINPADLPISPALQDALIRWARQYTSTLDRDDPRQSGFQSLEAESAFKAEGAVLLERLRAELGQSYNITLKT